MLETVVALLAINRIGAIAVPVFSGYGVDAIASRLNAVGAKALFTCDGFHTTRKDLRRVCRLHRRRSRTVRPIEKVIRRRTNDRRRRGLRTNERLITRRRSYYHELVDLA